VRRWATARRERHVVSVSEQGPSFWLHQFILFMLLLFVVCGEQRALKSDPGKDITSG
jgi:hypothetical protein